MYDSVLLQTKNYSGSKLNVSHCLVSLVCRIYCAQHSILLHSSVLTTMTTKWKTPKETIMTTSTAAQRTSIMYKAYCSRVYLSIWIHTRLMIHAQSQHHQWLLHWEQQTHLYGSLALSQKCSWLYDALKLKIAYKRVTNQSATNVFAYHRSHKCIIDSKMINGVKCKALKKSDTHSSSLCQLPKSRKYLVIHQLCIIMMLGKRELHTRSLETGMLAGHINRR